MGLRGSLQNLRSVLRDEVTRDLFYPRRDAARELDAARLPGIAEPVNELLAREDRGRGDGEIALGFRALLELDEAALLEEGALDERRIRELIAQRTGAIRPQLEEVLDDARVPPGEQP